MTKSSLFQPLRDWLFPAFDSGYCQQLAVSMKGPRQENQDNYLLLAPGGRGECLSNGQMQPLQIAHWGDQWYRLAVADGMGGHQHGREIAEALVQALPNIKPQKTPALLREAVYGLHQQLLQQFATNDDHSPGTTLTLVDVHISGLVLVAHVGDSRLYHWKRGHGGQRHWQQLTHDHTQEEFDWRSLQDEEALYWQAPNPTDKQHTVSQAMGYGSYGLLANAQGHRPLQFSDDLRLDLAEELPPHAQGHADVFSLRLQLGDALLLASDGLWAVPGKDSPRLPAPAELGSPDALAKLIWDALTADGSDNTTAVLFRSLRV